MSLKAIKYPIMVDPTTLLALYDMKQIGMDFPVASINKTMCPNCVEKSTLFAKEASEKLTSFTVVISTFVMLIENLCRWLRLLRY